MHFFTFRWKLAATVAWGLALLAGVALALVYQYAPAKTQAAEERWPETAICSLAPDRPTLVMFLHPHCPCSRASLNQLEELTLGVPGSLCAHVVFFQRSATDAAWAKSDLWDQAGSIPGLTLHLDKDGIVQRRFNASVSGETFLYASDGKLLFHGGITDGRGHMGDNPGSTALQLLLQGQTAASHTPVFGCQLTGPANQAPIRNGERLP
jgi:hypothetical protein